MSESNIKSTVRMYALGQPSEELDVGFRLWHSLDYNDLFDLADFLIDLCDFDLNHVPADAMESATRLALEGNPYGAALEISQYTQTSVDALSNFFEDSLGEHQSGMAEELEQIFEMTEIEGYKKLSKGLVLPLNPIFFGDADQFVTLQDHYYLYSMDGQLMVSKSGLHLFYDLVFTYVREDCRAEGQPVGTAIDDAIGGPWNALDGLGGKGGVGEMFYSLVIYYHYNQYTFDHPKHFGEILTDVFPFWCGCEVCFSGPHPPDGYTENAPREGASTISTPTEVELAGYGTKDWNENYDYTGQVSLAEFNDVSGPLITPPRLYSVGSVTLPAGALSPGYGKNALRGPDHTPLHYSYHWFDRYGADYRCLLPLKSFHWRSEEFTPGEPGSWHPPEGDGGGIVPIVGALSVLSQFGLRVTRRKEDV